MRTAPGAIARPGVRVMCEGGPGVLARRGVLVLTSVAAGWLAAGLTDLLWLLPAVPAVVWTAARTEVPRRAARCPVEPPVAVDRDWQTSQRRYEALRAVEASRWTQPDPAVETTAVERMREARRKRWRAVPLPPEAREGFDRWAEYMRTPS